MTSPTSRTPDSGSVAPNPGKPPEVEELVDEYFHRPLARPIVTQLAGTSITPNQVTLLACLIGVTSGIAVGLAPQYPLALPLGGLLLFLSVVLDCCDGQLARLKGINSTTGAILDGLSDYMVGLSLGIGAIWFMVEVYGSPWFVLLGVAGMASSAVQSALFDHAKTRYIARVAGGYSEREEDLDRVSRDLSQARSERRWKDALLLWLYRSYSKAQHAALSIPPVADPVAYRATHAPRMRAWTFLGIGTHFALAYGLCLVGYWWPPAIAMYFIFCVIPLNLVLGLLLLSEARQARA